MSNSSPPSPFAFSPPPFPSGLDFGGSNPASGFSNPSSFDSTAQFSPSMAIILVVLLSAFFFMGFFSIYVKRCTGGDESFNSFPGAATGGAGGGGAASRSAPSASQGVDPALLQALPLVAYSSTSKRRGGYNVECVVCLAEFEENEPLRQLPRCKHVFHQDCIDMWLFSHTTCPLCRRTVAAESWWSGGGGASGGGSIRLGLFGSRRSAGAATPPEGGGGSNRGRTEAAGEAELDVEERGGGAFSLAMQPERSNNWWFRRSNSTGHSLFFPRLRISTPPLARFVDTPEDHTSVDILQRSRSEADGRRRRQQQQQQAAALVTSGGFRRPPLLPSPTTASTSTYRPGKELGSPLSMGERHKSPVASDDGAATEAASADLEGGMALVGSAAMGCGLLRSLSRQGGDPFSGREAAHAFQRLM